MDLKTAQTFANTLFVTQMGRELRPPEITVFTGTWQGMTYEQMADASSYSANYLMRDIAPKFWRSLSKLLGENVGKTNLKVVIRKIYQNYQQLKPQQPGSDKDRGKQIIWNNSPNIPSLFYGHEKEIKKLQNWLETEHYQLIGLWGLSGTGKTLLMKKLAQQVQERFEVVLWRSLTKRPSLSELLQNILYQGFNLTESDPSKLISEFLVQLQLRPCLILIDGIESILQTEVFSGSYLEGYRDYSEFWRVIAESSHQSCIVFTSLENPIKITPATSQNSLIGYLQLSGLETQDAKSLLAAEFTIPPTTAESLIEYYQGNPGILKIVAQIVKQLFNGNVSEFLAQKSLVFGEINQFLAKSFSRLSVLETEILYWLASQDRSVSLSEIEKGIPLSIYPVELIEGLESLIQRSLVTSNQIEQRTVFVLSPMMREFVTNQFMAQIGDNFSVASRRNSLSTNNTIELGKTEQQPTHLSQWLKNRFEPGWQPIEVLFAASEPSPARLRSAFSLRGDRLIKRFKQIDLNPKKSITVLLLIAITPEEDALKICVQAQPAATEKILPKSLQLKLQDTQNTVLAKIVSEAEDNFIQLPYFRGIIGEQFKIGLNIDSSSYQEDFVI